nr:hypothetical protein [uncultured Desulfobulbus sp.]
MTCILHLSAQAADTAVSPSQTDWNATVNSLLATAMYGVGDNFLTGLSLHLQNSEANLPGLPHAESLLTTQAITFSYEGSSGLLQFSAGYLLSEDPASNKPAAVFLDIEPLGENFSLYPERSWYMALDLSRSYQLDDRFTLSLGNKALLLKNPHDLGEGRSLSLLLSMPITYKNYITITPEVQWTRPLPLSGSGSSSSAPSSNARLQSEDIFYGGLSISFSY